jgi:hypothetical protein
LASTQRCDTPLHRRLLSLGLAAHVLSDVKGVAFFNYSDQQLRGHPGDVRVIST